MFRNHTLRAPALAVTALALAACLDSNTTGPTPRPNPQPILNIFLIEGGNQTDSIGAVLQGIVVEVRAPGQAEGEAPPTVKGRQLGVVVGEECGQSVPATLFTDDATGFAEFGWQLGDLATECSLIVSLEVDDPFAGRFVEILSTVAAGRPVTDLVPAGTGLSSPTTLRLSPETLVLEDRAGNRVDWEIQLPDPGPILLSENQTSAGTEYILTALQPNGTTQAELHSAYGLEATFDITVCQESGLTVVKLFNPTAEVPTPGCV